MRGLPAEWRNDKKTRILAPIMYLTIPFMKFLRFINGITTSMHRHSLLMGLGVCLSIVHANAQVSRESVLKDFVSNRNDFYQEKVWIHTDQSMYIAGETLWASVYLVDGHLHRPSLLSGVAYVEIMDQGGKPVWQGSVRVSQGRGEFSQVLSTSIPTGHYMLRAYTRWMRNYDHTLFFSKALFILNPQKKPVWPATPRDSLYLDARAEGGALAVGVENRLTCRALDAGGNPVRQTLYLVDNGKDTLQTIRTGSNGYGEASFVPQKLHQYQLRSTDRNGQRITLPLPATESGGFALMVESEEEGLCKIIVRKSPDAEDAGCYVISHSRLTRPQVSYIPFKNNIAVTELSQRELGDGINQVWIADAQGKHRASRLLYRNPRQYLTVKTDLLPADIKRGQAVRIPFTATTSQGTATSGLHMTVSVHKVPDSTGTMLSPDPAVGLGVESDLVSPNIFPDPQSAWGFPQDLADRDLYLRIREGNPYFSLERVAGQQASPKLVPEKEGPVAEAVITNAATGLPAANIPISVSFSGLRYQFRMGQSDSLGHLTVPLEAIEGSGTIAFQPYDFSRDSFTISPVTEYDERKWARYFAPSPPGDATLRFLKERMIETQIAGSYGWTDQGGFNVRKADDSTAFFGKPDRRYFLDDYVRFKTMEEVLREYVQEVFVRKSGDQYSFQVTDVVNGGTFSEAPLVLLDGIPFRDANLVMKIDPLKIETISILGRRYQIGNQQFSGIIVLQTYDGSLEGIELPKDLLLADHAGLRIPRFFRTPPADAKQPDLRQLLYWNPRQPVDQAGRGVIDFRTSDVPGIYRAEWSLMDSQGRLGSGHIYFIVR